MSKQLAISSTFAIFAMAAMTLSLTADYRAGGVGGALVEMGAQVPQASPPQFDVWPF